VASEVVQLTLLTLPVDPSLKFPVAINCMVRPTCRLGFEGVTVILFKVGLTKKPRQPEEADTKTTAQTVHNNEFRLELRVIANLEEAPSAEDGLGDVLPIVANGVPPLNS